MSAYGVRDVEKLLRLPRRTIRALVAAGFVEPSRGPRNAWRFSFQDLIVLRTARALVAANVPHRRITQSVRALRKRLPDSMPLSGLSICAVADQVVVREGRAHWRADSGQYLFAFEADPVDGSFAVIDAAERASARAADAAAGIAAAAAADADTAFEHAIAIEASDPAAARRAYAAAIAADPEFLDARINLGRLLHDAGDLDEAERVYREALRVCGDDPLLQFNLGVLMSDLERRIDAIAAYEAAVRGDPSFADAHYNLALLYESADRPQDAIRHMAQYRRLVAKPR